MCLEESSMAQLAGLEKSPIGHRPEGVITVVGLEESPGARTRTHRSLATTLLINVV